MYHFSQVYSLVYSKESTMCRSYNPLCRPVKRPLERGEGLDNYWELEQDIYHRTSHKCERRKLCHWTSHNAPQGRESVNSVFWLPSRACRLPWCKYRYFGLIISNIKFKYLCLLNYMPALLSLHCQCSQVFWQLWPQVQSSPHLSGWLLFVSRWCFFLALPTQVRQLVAWARPLAWYICHSFRNVRLAMHQLPSAAHTVSITCTHWCLGAWWWQELEVISLVVWYSSGRRMACSSA